MNVVILDTVYWDFLQNIMRDMTSRTCKRSSIHDKIMGSYFGTSDAYSHNLQPLGVTASEYICNIPTGSLLNFALQLKNSGAACKMFLIFLKYSRYFELCTLEYLRKKKPDIIHCQDVHFFSHSFLREVKKHCNLLVGQLAAPLPSEKKLQQFGLLLSSLPNFVQYFRSLNIKSEYFPLGFDVRVCSHFKKSNRVHDVTFVGGLGRHHASWISFLEVVAEKTDLKIFGYGYENLPRTSILRKYHYGPVWGKDMYKVFAESKITINRHISISENYANNMRLYEATGMGALLLTDHKKNIDELFSVGREILTYASGEEAISKIHYYLKNWDQGAAIAHRGCIATHQRHSYGARMSALREIYARHV